MAGVCQQFLGLNNLFDDSSQALSLVHRLNCLPHTTGFKETTAAPFTGMSFLLAPRSVVVVPTTGGKCTGQKSIIKEHLVRLTAGCE